MTNKFLSPAELLVFMKNHETHVGFVDLKLYIRFQEGKPGVRGQLPENVLQFEVVSMGEVCVDLQLREHHAKPYAKKVKQDMLKTLETIRAYTTQYPPLSRVLLGPSLRENLLAHQSRFHSSPRL